MKKSTIRIIFLLIILFVNISLAQDSLKVADTTQKKIIDFVIPKYKHGSFSQLIDSNSLVIKKTELKEIHYSTLQEIYDHKLPVQILQQGSFGNYNTFSAFGALPANNSIKFNTRTINNFDFGGYNLSLFSPEFFEQLEFFYGSDAIVLGDNSNGSLINLQEIRYNTAKPYSKLWFAEGGFGFLAADGVFSQNFDPKWNFTFGFKNYNTNSRFPDTWANIWNVRGLLRFNPNKYRSFSLVYNFSNLGIGTGGGVNYDSIDNVYDNITTLSYYPDANEREFRHDITLSYSDLFDTLSIQSLSINSYISSSTFDRSGGRNFTFNNLDTTNANVGYFNWMAGANLNYELELIKNNVIQLGTEINYFIFDSSYLYKSNSYLQNSFWGRLNSKLTEKLLVSGGIRFTSKYEKVQMSFGGRIAYEFSHNFKYLLDFSYSEKIPEITEGLSLKNEKHLLAITGFEFRLDTLTHLNLHAFYRNINDPIIPFWDNNSINYLPVFKNEAFYNAYGLGLAVNTKLFNLINLYSYSEVNITDISSTKIKIFPLFSTKLDVNYRFSTLKSQLRIGIETKFSTAYNGLRYIPFNRAFLFSNYSSNLGFNYLNPYVHIKISNASLNLMLENVLSFNNYYLSVFPHNSINFKLTFNWAFLED